MTEQVLDGSIAVLWGSVTKTLNWVLLSPKEGTVSIAKVEPAAFWVRDNPAITNIDRLADEALIAWKLVRAGRDLDYMATHRLAPPHMQIIEPLAKEQR
jgi:hypothetical protein